MALLRTLVVKMRVHANQCNHKHSNFLEAAEAWSLPSAKLEFKGYALYLAKRGGKHLSGSNANP